MPRMMEAIMVRTRVKKKLPPESTTMPLAILSPTPERVTTPMIIPAQAQAAETPTADRAPVSRASKISFMLSRVFFRSMAMATVTMMQTRAALRGVYPLTRR